MKKLFLIILLSCIKQLNAQVCFTSANYTVPNSSTTIACADFNSDGKLDLVVAAANSPIYMLLGNGLGSFGASNIVYNHANYGYTSFVSADFNNDGKADLAIAEGGFYGYVRVLFGNGAGSFPTTDSLAVGTYPSSICSADFNGDGKIDLVTGNKTYYTSDSVSVLLGDGAGNFSTHVDFFAGFDLGAITSGDFNGDGKTDLAVTDSANSVRVLLGNGSGSFGTSTKYPAGSGGTSGLICSKDFNADGFTDIAVATNWSGVSVLLSKGVSGAFFAPTNYLAGNSPFSVVSADFNSDGIPDLAVGDYSTASISVLLGTGTGSFGAASNVAALDGSKTIISADFNGDGKPDLATTNESSQGISVLLNVDAPHVNITTSHSSAICAGISITLTASGATTYTWSSNTGVSKPNDTVTTVVVTPLTSNTYTVVVEKNGCKDSAAILITVVPPAVPTICMVTTDIASNYNYNIVYWDKTLYSNVDSFIVYRKDAISSNYLRIGAVSKNSLSEFTDTSFSIGGPNGGNPQYSSWIYNLAIRDTCGNIGAKSPYHQSMFFQKNGSNFSWNAYTLETGQTSPITGYSFLRDDNNTGNWHVLVNTIGLSTTDPDYASYPNGNWRVDALGFDCTPTANKTQSTYLKSHSNTIKLVTTGIQQLALNNEQITVYPNPTTGNFIIETTVTEKQSVQVFDLNGRLVFNQNIRDKTNIDATTLNEGIYNLTIKTGDRVVNKKLVIIR